MLLVDDSSCTNVALASMMKKLQLPMVPHHRPYKLQWLNDQGQLYVDSQVNVPISIRNRYQDDVLCDVLPMSSSHVLFGRPWQYDVNDQHTGKEV